MNSIKSNFSDEHSWKVPDNLNDILKKIDSLDYTKRNEGINELASYHNEESARLLVEVLFNAGWRDLKRKVLLQLSNFLEYERVFFALQKILQEPSDTPLCLWALETFKYSGTNQYERYLENLYSISFGLIRDRILEVLIYNGSRKAINLLEKELKEFELDFEKLGDPTYFGLFLKIPYQLQISTVQFCGVFRKNRYIQLLHVVMKMKDPLLSRIALINLLKYGVDYKNLREDIILSNIETHHELPVIQDELITIYSEFGSLFERHADSVPIESCRGKETGIPERIYPLLSIDQNSLPKDPRSENDGYLSLLIKVSQFHINEDCWREFLLNCITSKIEGACVGEALHSLLTFDQLDKKELIKKAFNNVYPRNPTAADFERFTKFIEKVHFTPDTFHLIIPHIHEILYHQSVAPPIAISIVNMLVFEFHQLLPTNSISADIIETITYALEIHYKNGGYNQKSIILRLCRAHGQIQCVSSLLLKVVNSLIYSEKLYIVERNALLYVLSENKNHEEVFSTAVSIARKVYKKKNESKDQSIIGNADSERLLLNCFTTSKYKLPSDIIQKITNQVNRCNYVTLLRVIYSQQSPEARRWILEQIGNKDELSYKEIKWLLKCIHPLGTDEMISFLKLIIFEQEPTLQRLAAFSLGGIKTDAAIAGSLEVISILLQQRRDFDIAEIILHNLTTPSIRAIPDVLTTIQAILAQGIPDFLYEPIIEYMSSLKVITDGTRIEYVKTSHPKAIEAVVTKLCDQVKGFTRLPSVVQSVFLSAEIPLHHTDLFDQSIDKSSSILQFIKALDIYLHENIGTFFMKQENLKIIQEIICQAALDRLLALSASPKMDEILRFNTSILQVLNLSAFFEPRKFPIIKFRAIISAILNNSLVKDEFKVIDGLKGWGLLLLLLTQPLKNVPTTPLFHANKQSLIIDLCEQLFELQECRNPIAHRSTVFDNEAIFQVRRKVFAILQGVQDLAISG